MCLLNHKPTHEIKIYMNDEVQLAVKVIHKSMFSYTKYVYTICPVLFLPYRDLINSSSLEFVHLNSLYNILFAQFWFLRWLRN